MRTSLLLATLVGLAAFACAQGKTYPLAGEKKQLVSLEKTYKSAKAKSRRKPTDTTLKAAYSSATSAYGFAVMSAQSIKVPRERYVKALRLFREALVANPKNEEAKKNKDLIEGIYKQMGKPIPD